MKLSIGPSNFAEFEFLVSIRNIRLTTEIIDTINPFQAMFRFLYPLKTSEN